jgi:hypothetical protein
MKTGTKMSAKASTMTEREEQVALGRALDVAWVHIQLVPGGGFEVHHNSGQVTRYSAARRAAILRKAENMRGRWPMILQGYTTTGGRAHAVAIDDERWRHHAHGPRHSLCGVFVVVHRQPFERAGAPCERCKARAHVEES